MAIKLILKEGLIDRSGNMITGSDISSIDPDEITYIGSDKKEIETVKKWAEKGNRKFIVKKKI
jgi:hypothetical protein